MYNENYGLERIKSNEFNAKSAKSFLSKDGTYACHAFCGGQGFHISWEKPFFKQDLEKLALGEL